MRDPGFRSEISRFARNDKEVIPLHELEIVIRHFGRVNRIDYFTGRYSLSARAKKSVDRTIKARLAGKPLQVLLKEAPFFGHTFFVSPHVLVPRPETELLVEEALRILSSRVRSLKATESRDQVDSSTSLGMTDKNPSILDIGTGSGCIAVSLTIARPDCRMTALDLSPKALSVARKNRDSHGLRSKIQLVHSDLFKVFRGKKRAAWDMIVSNPPYIPEPELNLLPRDVQTEPRLALDGGADGLSVVRRLLDEAPAYLKKDGFILIEIGKGQSEHLAKEINRDKRYKNLRFIKDYNGIDRVLIANIE
ncbi:MAG: peptide chain release factor N(5)-glutamine methyltransferase [Candidatus Omnitrophica bacterium]|nr:peptide chain release factor N(5)-glutamine methyltransferase [Candidatus Omnitrophota bacterium]